MDFECEQHIGAERMERDAGGSEGSERRGEVQRGDSSGGEAITDSRGGDFAVSAAAGAIGAACGSCGISVRGGATGEFDGGHHDRSTNVSAGAGAGGDADRGAETGDGAGETGGDAGETFRAGALPRDGGDESCGGTGSAEGLDRGNAERTGPAGICEGRRPVDSVRGDGTGANRGGRLHVASVRADRRGNFSNFAGADSHAANAQLERAGGCYGARAESDGAGGIAHRLHRGGQRYVAGNSTADRDSRGDAG